MMSDKPKPSYAPVYAAIYPELALLFREHGYALAIHGSLSRDFDLIAVPWVASPTTPEFVVKDVTNTFDIILIGEGTKKLHNRTAYTISIGHGHCALDLSFMSVIAGPCAFCGQSREWHDEATGGCLGMSSQYFTPTGRW